MEGRRSEKKTKKTKKNQKALEMEDTVVKSEPVFVSYPAVLLV